MATFFGSPPFISHPIVRTQHLSSSSQPPPPPLPPSQPQPPLSKSSERGGKAKGTSADSTDWIASSLTRRFGLGAGLAWAGFLAFGVVSEQIKTRFEVTQQQANTRFVFIGTWMYQNSSKRSFLITFFQTNCYSFVAKTQEQKPIVINFLSTKCHSFVAKTCHYPKSNIMVWKVDPFLEYAPVLKDFFN